MLPEEDIRSLYSSEYFEGDYLCGVGCRPYREEVEGLKREVKPLLSMIQKFQTRGRYLEIGCAGGAMLAEARNGGFDTVGVELSSEMAEWGRKHLQLDIREGKVETQNFPEDSFNVVFLGDVIEHLPNPRTVLEEIRRILEPEGIVALAYPMELNSLVPRVRSAFHLGRQSPHKPYHLFYYDTCTMKALLEQCGFEELMTKEDKLIRADAISSLIMDFINYMGTSITGRWGDRGFTIACLK
jgi:SAM-dependent methyltransferase